MAKKQKTYTEQQAENLFDHIAEAFGRDPKEEKKAFKKRKKAEKKSLKEAKERVEMYKSQMRAEEMAWEFHYESQSTQTDAPPPLQIQSEDWIGRYTRENGVTDPE